MITLVHTSRNLFLLLLITTFHFSFSQSTIPKNEIIKLENKAREYVQNREYFQALPIFLKLHETNPNSPEYNYVIGYCYVNLDDDKAISYLEFCIKNPSKEYPDHLFYEMGRVYHLGHRFEEAIEYYEKFRATIQKPEKHPDWINEIEHEEEMCRNGIDLMKNNQGESIDMSDAINSEYPDYGPLIAADGSFMLFTSCRPNTTGGKIDPYDGRYYEDIYISYHQGDSWSEPENLSHPVNTSENDAAVALSSDGQSLIIYRSTPSDAESGAFGDLYISHKEGEVWGVPELLPSPINTEMSWEPSATMSDDENMLIFASNRADNNIGGTDLYMIKKLPNGEWAQPLNLGPTINTIYNEDSPYLHPDGVTLYFSSQGHKSIGGYDIFYTKYDAEKNSWSEPQNIGFPINTAHDDLYFCLSPDGTRVYYSSHHHETKGFKDIYYTEIEQKTANMLLKIGSVLDTLNDKPIESKITVTDVKTGLVEGVFHSNSNNGRYTILLKEDVLHEVKVVAEGYETFTYRVRVPYLNEFIIKEKDFHLVPLTPKE